MTAALTKNAIQISGAPEEEICQNTTGVRRKSNVIASVVLGEDQREAKEAKEKAVITPPRKMSPIAAFSLPRARPNKINKWFWPQRKLLDIENSG